MKKNKIVMTGETEFQDTELREYMTKMEKKLQNINERTKIHTSRIRDLEKEIKKCS